MTRLISLLAQKGGVGKSTLSRLLATDLIASGINAAIIDMDLRQQTSYEWTQRRQTNNIQPRVPVLQAKTASALPKLSSPYDLVVVDTPPYSSTLSLEVANLSTLILLPTRNRLDDLVPQVRLANDLVKHGIAQERIVFVFNAVGSSQVDYQSALDYLTKTNYLILEAFIPYRTAYGKSMDEGRALSEASFSSLQEKALAVSQHIINLIV